MADKVYLVSGATSGIGRATASALAARGAEVIVAGRNRQKAEETVSRIKSETGNTALWYLLADFADLDQVREMARALKARTSRLDVLVNNAGTFFNTRHGTPYGVEMTFLVNHLAPFLLTNLLLDTLQDSAPARIVNVSSAGHQYDEMDFDNLGFKRGYAGMKAYARSKLANVLFTYELARRLDASQVTANAVHPGHVATDMWKTNFPLIGPALKWMMGLFARTPEQGADTVIYLASSPDVERITGMYFADREAIPSSPVSYDEEVAQRLWQISEDLTRPQELDVSRPESKRGQPA
jgi:NAD(P)-dependent dehydrogenase (short-subunit alcohol dehydrogenase family)